MKYCTLYLDDITEKAALHARLAGALMLPDHYGRNLDALKDCLTDVREDMTITVKGYRELQTALGGYAVSLGNVLRDTAEENPHISVHFD